MFPFFPFPYPFNVRSNDWRDNRGERIYLEKQIRMRKALTLEIENKILNRNVKKLAKWVEDMKELFPHKFTVKELIYRLR